MAKRYCKICGAEWEENFTECYNCGMPADPDEQLWFDTEARKRVESRGRKRLLRPVSKLNRGIFLPLILGCGAVLKIIVQGGFNIGSLAWDIIGFLMFVVSVGHIIKAKFFRR